MNVIKAYNFDDKLMAQSKMLQERNNCTTGQARKISSIWGTKMECGMWWLASATVKSWTSDSYHAIYLLKAPII